jgi:malate synthase
LRPSWALQNFYAPVQAQVLQTGANARAKVKQNSQQNQLYAQMMIRELENISSAVKQEIEGEDDQAAASAIVEKAKMELGKEQVKPGKIQKLLSGLGKWTGERTTKAVDAAIEVGVKYGMTGSGQ